MEPHKVILYDMFFRRIIINALLVGALFSAFCLTGCGRGRIEESTLVINKDGSVDSIIVDAFDKYYYNEADLEKSAKEEVERYNAEHGKDTVRIRSLKTGDDGSVRAELSFRTSEDYARFNETRFFAGTVKEAEEKGYVFTTALKSVDGENETISSHEVILERADSHIVITDETIDLRMYSKIQYVSPGVTVVSPKEARVEDDMEGLAYVIFK